MSNISPRCLDCHDEDLQFRPNVMSLNSLRQPKPSWVCPRCNHLFGVQDDGSVVRREAL
jgi:transposase-like protein